ncbi:hypothetical protein FBZ84_103469 [Azospirillum baldaniorum]|nr:hypothetical protein FBZ84_103469 [Azospirillum baldaniorum]
MSTGNSFKLMSVHGTDGILANVARLSNFPPFGLSGFSGSRGLECESKPPLFGVKPLI